MTHRTSPAQQYTGKKNKSKAAQTIKTDLQCTKFIDFNNLDMESLEHDLTFESRSITVDNNIYFQTKKRPEVRYFFS